VVLIGNVVQALHPRPVARVLQHVGADTDQRLAGTNDVAVIFAGQGGPDAQEARKD